MVGVPWTAWDRFPHATFHSEGRGVWSFQRESDHIFDDLRPLNIAASILLSVIVACEWSMPSLSGPASAILLEPMPRAETTAATSYAAATGAVRLQSEVASIFPMSWTEINESISSTTSPVGLIALVYVKEVPSYFQRKGYGKILERQLRSAL